MGNKTSRDNILEDIALRLLALSPSSNLAARVNTVADIYRYRQALKAAPCDEDLLAHLASIVLEALKKRVRFRKMDSLTVLRCIIRNCESGHRFSPATIAPLFDIYREVILSISEEGQWAASVLIKDQHLAEEQIQWLIEHAHLSVHPLNRLLLYPEYSPTIASWAETVYKQGSYLKRRSELIALVIEHHIPEAAIKEDTPTILWAIARSRIPVSEKQRLLRETANPIDFPILAEIASKLKLPDLMEYMIAALKDAPAA